jgi:hypothetical protein
MTWRIFESPLGDNVENFRILRNWGSKISFQYMVGPIEWRAGDIQGICLNRIFLPIPQKCPEQDSNPWPLYSGSFLGPEGLWQLNWYTDWMDEWSSVPDRDKGLLSTPQGPRRHCDLSIVLCNRYWCALSLEVKWEGLQAHYPSWRCHEWWSYTSTSPSLHCTALK